MNLLHHYSVLHIAQNEQTQYKLTKCQIKNVLCAYILQKEYQTTIYITQVKQTLYSWLQLRYWMHSLSFIC